MQHIPWKSHGLISFADAYDYMDFNRRAKKRKLKEIMFGVNELADSSPNERAMSDEHVRCLALDLCGCKHCCKKRYNCNNYSFIA